MIDTTLVFLLRDGEILLAMKKRGFGAGHWNGAGGKLEEGEDVVQAAIREAEEEIGVRIQDEDLKYRGRLDFYFENKPEWDQAMHIYIAEKWTGEPAESEEMKPQWFRFEDVPYDSMWPDDKLWLPALLKGEEVNGEFKFDASGKEILSWKLE